MPINDRKIISIILQESEKVESRCEGYHEAIIEGIGDIIAFEREHNVVATNVQKKITDKCNAIGRFLSEQLEKS